MRVISVIWGLGGILLLIGSAIVRLAPRGLEALKADLSVIQWIVLVVFTLFMLVAEGYRGFQKKFSPRTAARVRYLRDHTTPLRMLLAPFFCMGYFFANKKTRIIAIALPLVIILLIVGVSRLPFPWRGIIDVGVVLGLTYGVVSLLIFSYQALTQKEFAHSPETPE